MSVACSHVQLYVQPPTALRMHSEAIWRDHWVMQLPQHPSLTIEFERAPITARARQPHGDSGQPYHSVDRQQSDTSIRARRNAVWNACNEWCKHSNSTHSHVTRWGSPPMYPTRVLITPGRRWNTSSTDQKQPAASTITAVAAPMGIAIKCLCLCLCL